MEDAAVQETEKPSLISRLFGVVRGVAGLLLAGIMRLWARFRRFWLWVFLFWVAASVLGWSFMAARSLEGLGDTDDALRLVQWRLFRDGAAWHDLLIARMGIPDGLESHWSRLVDAGLLLLYWPLSLFMTVDEAETFMRLTWPLLLLLPLMAAIAIIARRAAGHRALMPALLLTALALPAQFMPGRIDHHNAQIVLLMLAWAFLFAGLRRRLLLLPSGFAVPMTLAIGLEALPFVIAVPGVVAVGWATGRLKDEKAPVLFGGGLLVGAIAMLFSALPPSRLLHTACDAYAANWALPLALSGAGLALLPLLPARWMASGKIRLTVLGVLAALSAVLFIALDPRCLQGPFTGMNEIARAAWLAHVSEMQPITHLLDDSKGLAMSLATAGWGILALLIWIASPKRRHEDLRIAETFLAMTVTMAVVLGLLHIRLLAYVQWLAVPLMAAGLVRLAPKRHKLHDKLRATGALFLSPLSVALAVMLLMPSGSIAPGKGEKAAAEDPGECLKDAALKPLATLPAGFLAADIRLQPYILARTPHRVLAGPYHRLGESIEANIRLFAEPPEKARLQALTLGLDYIAVCPGTRFYGLDGQPVTSDSLWQYLLRGEVPEWLEPVRLSAPTPIRVYRVRANRPLPAVIDVPKELLEGIKPGTDAPGLRQTLHE